MFFFTWGRGKVYHTGAGHFPFCDCGARLGIGIHPAALCAFCKDNSERIAEVTLSGQEGMDPTLPSGRATTHSEEFEDS